jgi:hypothetical protein
MYRGRQVTSLGVLFDFTSNDRNTTVQKVADMVKEAWVSLLMATARLDLATDDITFSSLKLYKKSPISFSSLG